MASQEKERLLTSEDLVIRKEYSTHDDDDDDEIVEAVEEVPVCCSYRLWVIICCTLSMTITYAAQASLSAAMVCMIEDTDYHKAYHNISRSHENTTIFNSTTIDFLSLGNATDNHEVDWLFTWDKSKQGLAIASFFMGYYVSQIPSSVLAARFGPKRLMVVSLILVSIFQALAVPAAYYGIGWLYADRVIVGIMDGFLYVPTFALAGHWAPRHETSLLFGIVGMGMELGNVLSYATSLLACEIVVQEGWPFVFYILAGLGLIVAALIMIVVSDSPYQNRHISRKEVKYFVSLLPKRQAAPNPDLSPVPVKEILSSLSVWAIIVSQIGSDWLYYFFVTMEPTFLKDVIKLSNAEVNLLSGLPFLGIIPTIYLAGYLCDRLVTKGVISNTKIRKINDFICKIIPAGVLIGLGFLPQDSTAGAFVLNLFGAMCMGFSYVSWMANPVDLAPAYTGFIVGICEIGAIWVAIVVPIVSDDITVDKTREEWQLVFYITAGIQVVCFLFYAVFASGELQPWAVTTLKHSYEDLDDHIDALLEEGMKSRTNSHLSHRSRPNDDDDNHLLLSLSLSLGDFRGTSSYEASMKRKQDRRKQDAVEGSSTLLITGPAHKSAQLKDGYIPTKSSGTLQTGRYQIAGMDVIIGEDNDKPGYYISNGALVVPKSAIKGGLDALRVEAERYLESDEYSWQNIATRSLPNNLLRSVSHGRGDLDISSSLSPSLTSGQLDDESSTEHPRNVKSLAVEIAEALSVHSLNEPVGNDKAAKPASSGTNPAGSSNINDTNKNVNDKGKTLSKAQQINKTEMNRSLDITTSRNIKYLKHRNHPRNRRIPPRDKAIKGFKDPQLNSGSSSSIMLPSEDLTDSMDSASLNAKRGNSHGSRAVKNKDHNSPKQMASLVKRFLLFGKSKSTPHLSLVKEEPFVYVTDNDVKENPWSDMWATRSVDSSRNTKAAAKQNPTINEKATTNNTIKEEDENTLFESPHGKFKEIKK